MKQLACVAVVLVACTSQAPLTPTPAAEAPAAGRALDLAAVVAASDQASKPVEAHRQLARLAGQWSIVSAGIDEQGRTGLDVFEGTAELGMILGGRYLLWRETQQLPGGPRESVGFVAYDKIAREWQWSMATDLSTGIGVARGEGSLEAGVRFVMELVDAQSGAVLRSRSRFVVLSDNELLLERLGAAPDGTERTMRRVLYRRLMK